MPLALRPATAADVPELLAMMRAFYAADGLPFGEPAAREALEGLIADPRAGAAWLLELDGECVGYAVLGLGYSLEFHGRDAFVDELFVRDGFRGRGVGTRALVLIESECRRLGVRALHLEVGRNNARAQALYRRAGFVDHDRLLLTKRL